MRFRLLVCVLILWSSALTACRASPPREEVFSVTILCRYFYFQPEQEGERIFSYHSLRVWEHEVVQRWTFDELFYGEWRFLKEQLMQGNKCESTHHVT